MKAKRFKPEQISAILQEYDNGKDVQIIIRDHGVSKTTFYKWRQLYQGMDISSLKRLKELEQENLKLKHMYADIALYLKIAKEIIEKKAIKPCIKKAIVKELYLSKKSSINRACNILSLSK